LQRGLDESAYRDPPQARRVQRALFAQLAAPFSIKPLLPRQQLQQQCGQQQWPLFATPPCAQHLWALYARRREHFVFSRIMARVCFASPRSVDSILLNAVLFMYSTLTTPTTIPCTLIIGHARCALPQGCGSIFALLFPCTRRRALGYVLQLLCVTAVCDYCVWLLSGCSAPSWERGPRGNAVHTWDKGICRHVWRLYFSAVWRAVGSL